MAIPCSIVIPPAWKGNTESKRNSIIASFKYISLSTILLYDVLITCNDSQGKWPNHYETNTNYLASCIFPSRVLHSSEIILLQGLPKLDTLDCIYRAWIISACKLRILLVQLYLLLVWKLDLAGRVGVAQVDFAVTIYTHWEASTHTKQPKLCNYEPLNVRWSRSWIYKCMHARAFWKMIFLFRIVIQLYKTKLVSFWWAYAKQL